MPVYEFACNACGARVSLFFRSMNTEVSGVCDRCGSADLSRRFSKFAIRKPGYDPASINQAKLMDGLDEKDPESVAQFLRRMNTEFGEEADPYQEEMIQRLERGQDIDSATGMDVFRDDGHGHDDYVDAGGASDDL